MATQEGAARGVHFARLQYISWQNEAPKPAICSMHGGSNLWLVMETSTIACGVIIDVIFDAAFGALAWVGG
jgi:hypothetical protein